MTTRTKLLVINARAGPAGAVLPVDTIKALVPSGPGATFRGSGHGWTRLAASTWTEDVAEGAGRVSGYVAARGT